MPPSHLAGTSRPRLLRARPGPRDTRNSAQPDRGRENTLTRFPAGSRKIIDRSPGLVVGGITYSASAAVLGRVFSVNVVAQEVEDDAAAAVLALVLGDPPLRKARLIGDPFSGPPQHRRMLRVRHQCRSMDFISQSGMASARRRRFSAANGPLRGSLG